jgi:integrase
VEVAVACLTTDSKGRKYIQVNELPGRPKLWLGDFPKKMAESVLVKVEALLIAKASGQPLDHMTAAWVGEIARTPVKQNIYTRLVDLGLVQPVHSDVEVVTLGAVLDRYIKGRSKLKPNTLRNYLTTQRLLQEHFGSGRATGTIHAGQARDYREWLISKYSPATVAREIKRARQFFEYAKDCRITEQNPFAKIKAGSQKNVSRKHFVGQETIETVMAACPDNEWRLLLAFARYGGLRTPSELAALTWGRINWEQGRFTVRVPKKEHLDGHGERVVPIFPELRPYLEQAFEEASEGDVFVVPRARSSNVNLRTGLLRILKKAGVAAWPKLFQNLRASRETELMREYPAHVVHAWLGNSREVAEDHYLMVTEEDYERATKNPATIAVHFSVQPDAVSGIPEPSPEKESAVSPAVADYTADQIPPRGVEPRFSD